MVLTRWRAKLKVRQALLRRALKRGDKKLIAKRRAQVDYAERVVKRHTPRKRLTATVAFDGIPIFRGLAFMLQDARDHGWEGRLNSADRRHGVAERYGKSSQVALYLGWVKHLVGFNPANPPGRSTHELRSDGVAYRGPIGRPLSWYQLGMDASNALQLRVVLNRIGYDAFRPYRSGSEAHHVNLKKSPTRNLRKRHRA